MNDYPCQPIVLWSKAIKNYPCHPVSEFGERSVNLVEQMKKTMHYMNGVGIAAPQINVFKRVAIAVLDRRTLAMFNPEVVSGDGDTIAWEACLSLPGCSGRPNFKLLTNHARVHRLAKILVRYQDVHGKPIEEEFTGAHARTVLHEIDHLTGVFFIDRCGPIFRDIVLRNLHNYIEYMELQSQSA